MTRSHIKKFFYLPKSWWIRTLRIWKWSTILAIGMATVVGLLFRFHAPTLVIYIIGAVCWVVIVFLGVKDIAKESKP